MKKSIIKFTTLFLIILISIFFGYENPELIESTKSLFKKKSLYQLSEAEVDALIDEAFKETGAKTIKEMGKVMGWIKPKGQGKVDMGLVSAKIRKRLT